MTRPVVALAVAAVNMTHNRSNVAVFRTCQVDTEWEGKLNSIKEKSRLRRMQKLASSKLRRISLSGTCLAKHQIPSSKLQRNSKLQFPNSNRPWPPRPDGLG